MAALPWFIIIALVSGLVHAEDENAKSIAPAPVNTTVENPAGAGRVPDTPENSNPTPENLSEVTKAPGALQNVTTTEKFPAIETETTGAPENTTRSNEIPADLSEPPGARGNVTTANQVPDIATETSVAPENTTRSDKTPADLPEAPGSPGNFTTTTEISHNMTTTSDQPSEVLPSAAVAVKKAKDQPKVSVDKRKNSVNGKKPETNAVPFPFSQTTTKVTSSASSCVIFTSCLVKLVVFAISVVA